MLNIKGVLSCIYEQSTKRKIPVLTNPTKDFITNVLNKYRPKNCLEIWWCIAYSTIFIASTIQDRSWKISSFEISYPSYKEWLNNIRNSKLFNINFYNWDFSKFPIKKLTSQKYDFVFIDAMKKEYLKYFKSIRHLLSDNCILIFDDVIKFDYKMEDLYEFLKKNQLNYEIIKLDEDDWILVIKL